MAADLGAERAIAGEVEVVAGELRAVARAVARAVMETVAAWAASVVVAARVVVAQGVEATELVEED